MLWEPNHFLVRLRQEIHLMPSSDYVRKNAGFTKIAFTNGHFREMWGPRNMIPQTAFDVRKRIILHIPDVSMHHNVQLHFVTQPITKTKHKYAPMKRMFFKPDNYLSKASSFGWKKMIATKTCLIQLADEALIRQTWLILVNNMPFRRLIKIVSIFELQLRRW